jgi:hypothetical protein
MALFGLFKEKTYIFTFPTTKARYIVTALNRRSAFKKFVRMLPSADEELARQFKCDEK